MSLNSLKHAVITVAIFAPFAAQAQWFGPKNLEECVLDKMKGQPPNMVGIARAACLKLFPQEALLSEDEAKSTWCETNPDSIEACVTLKDGYKITKAIAVFSQSKCEGADLNFFSANVNAEAKLPMFGSTYKFPLANANSYKCARFMFYGHKRP